jgi:cytochrome c oxidase subunit II
MWSSRGHGFRIGVLTAVATVIALPLVIFVLGPAMPPGNWTDTSKGQVFDNTVLLVVMTPFTMFILVYLGYALRAFRADDPRSATPKDGAPIRGHMPSQVVWLATTTAAVLFLAIFGSAELLASGAGGGQGPKPITKPSGQALQVQVIGQQWEFTYRYPSYGGIETAQLVLPVDTEVEFHVTSLDVIHSFWAYELGVKADANPGIDNVAFVKPDRIGTFQIRCAELCGLWHGYMYDTGKVVTAAQFASWIASQRAEFTPVQKYLPPYSTTYSPDPTARAG